MKLWLLRPVDDLPEGGNPWEPWFDKAFGFVVRAETEDEARNLARENAGEEGWPSYRGTPPDGTPDPWGDAQYSTCMELSPEGEAGIVLNDFASA